MLLSPQLSPRIHFHSRALKTQPHLLIFNHPLSLMDAAPISAVIFDLDGTILDTERVGKEILRELLARYGKVPDAEKEDRRFGKMYKDTVDGIISDYELPITADQYSSLTMPLYQQKWAKSKAIPGANRLIRHLHMHGIPIALASNSIRSNLDTKISYQRGWRETFSVILSGDEVKQGKPSPDIFLEAAKRLDVDTKNCLVIEDSPVGVRAAKAAGAKIVAVPSLKNQAEQYSAANCMIHSLLEFQPELWGLPAFQDWIGNALPIEPLHINCLIGDIAPLDGCTMLDIIAESYSNVSIPDQVSGVFIGWAKLETLETYKVVVSTGWEVSSTISRRVIKCHLFGRVNNYSKERVQLLLVGYIRKQYDEEDMTEALRLTEEDNRTAEAALDLAIFSFNDLVSELDFDEECVMIPSKIE